MYRMAITTMCCPDPSIKKDRCVKMAIVHDLAEAIVGDITPLDPVSKPEKHRREFSTMEYLTRDLLAPISKTIADEFLGLFEEYEAGETPEAVFVKDIDCYELVLQTVEYEKRYGKDLSEFLHVAKRVKTAYVKAWIEEALAERKGNHKVDEL